MKFIMEEQNNEKKVIKNNKIDEGSQVKINKKNKKKPFIILGIVLGVILIVTAIIIGITITKVKDDDENKKISTGSEIGDATLKILDNEDISKYNDVNISFKDLDLDGVSEFIIKYLGLKDATADSPKQQIKVYKLKDNTEYENKVNIGVKEDESNLDLVLLYNKKESNYEWYEKVSNGADVVYHEFINQLKETKTNEPEKEYKEGTTDFRITLEQVETEYGKEVKITEELSKEELAEKINEALNGYISTEDMISKKQEAKINKIDESKEIVYTAVEKNVGDYKFEIPAINVNTDEIINLNKEILDNGNKLIEGTQNMSESGDGYSFEYKYYLNNNIVSLVTIEHYPYNGYETHEVYNYDIYTGEKIEKEELMSIASMTEDDVIKASKKEFGNYFKKMFKSTGAESTEYYTQAYNDTIASKNCGTDNPMFLGENGNLSVIATIYTMAGSGQYEYIINLQDSSKNVVKGQENQTNDAF